MAASYIRSLKSLLLLGILLIPILQICAISENTVHGSFKEQFLSTQYGDDTLTRAPIFPSINQKLVVNTTRTLKISEFSLVSLNDTVVIKNQDDREFNAILVYYEKSLFSKLMNLRVISFWLDKDQFIESQLISYIDAGEYIGLAVLFNRIIANGESYKISLLADLTGMISFRQYEDTLRFYLNITRDILIPLHVNNSITQVMPPLYSEIIDTLMQPREGFGVQGNRVFWKTEDLAPFNESIRTSSLVKISYVYRLKDPIQLPLQVLYAKRTLTIGISGNVEITDTVRVTAFTPEKPVSIESSKWKTQSIILGLAGKIDVGSVVARDNFGSLKVTEETLLEKDRFENYTFIKVTLRNPLVGGESYEISIEYLLGDQALTRNGDEFEVVIPLMPIINASVSLFELEINSPYDISIDNMESLPSPIYTKVLYKKGAFFIANYINTRIIYSNVYSSENRLVKLNFQLDPLVILNAYIMVFEYVFILVGAMVLFSRMFGKKKVAVKIEEAPRYRVIRENLIKFIASYEEYLSKEDEILTEVRDKAISKRPIARVSQSLTLKLEELRRKKSVVYEYSEKIKDDPDIVPLIKKLEELDTKTDIVRRKLFDDLNRHLRGAMKRSEFINEANLSLKEILRYIKGKRRILNSLRDILIVKYSATS